MTLSPIARSSSQSTHNASLQGASKSEILILLFSCSRMGRHAVLPLYHVQEGRTFREKSAFFPKTVHFDQTNQSKTSFLKRKTNDYTIFGNLKWWKEGFFYKSKLVMSIEEMKEYFYNDIPVKMQVHFLHKDKKVVFSVTEVQQHAIATMTKFLFDKK